MRSAKPNYVLLLETLRLRGVVRQRHDVITLKRYKYNLVLSRRVFFCS